MPSEEVGEPNHQAITETSTSLELREASATQNHVKSYKSPLRTFMTILEAAKNKEYGVFEEGFTVALLAEMEKRGLSSEGIIKIFLESPEATLVFKNRFEFINKGEGHRGRLVLKTEEKEISHAMVLQNGKWRFEKPFFLMTP